MKLLNLLIILLVEFTGKNIYGKFKGSCLKQDKVTFNHEKIVNIYIVYDLESNLNNFDPTLENCLFGAIKLTKNSDINKYIYSGYGLGFGSKGTFSHPDGTSFGQNVLIFGVDMSSSVHASNRTNNILVLGKDFTQGISGTTIYAEKIYSPNFTETRKKFFLSLHYNGGNNYLFVNGTEVYKFKAKESEIEVNPLSVSNMKKTGFYGSVFDFSVNYIVSTVHDILDIQKYLMKKNGLYYKIFRFIKQVFIAAMAVFSFNVLSVNPLECVSLKNQECKARPKIISTNTNEPIFYSFQIKISKCSGSCNNINSPYAKLCVRFDAKVFDLMQRIN